MRPEGLALERYLCLPWVIGKGQHAHANVIFDVLWSKASSNASTHAHQLDLSADHDVDGASVPSSVAEVKPVVAPLMRHHERHPVSAAHSSFVDAEITAIDPAHLVWLVTVLPKGGHCPAA